VPDSQEIFRIPIATQSQATVKQAQVNSVRAIASAVPGSLRTERVRKRCRGVLDERRRQRTSWKQPPPATKAFDVCLVAVGIYLAQAVSEAVRLGGFF
jgi:hypothetical protein